MKALETKSWLVLNYCEIPEKISEICSSLQETTCDVFVEHSVTSKEDQAKYDDDFTLDNWILENWPDLSGKKILIHVDY